MTNKAADSVGLRWSVLSASCLQEFRRQFRLCADLAFRVRAHAAGFCFCCYAREAGQFRVRAGQLSGGTSLTRQEQDAVVRASFPTRPPAWLIRLVRWHYRLLHVPRYLRRWGQVGWTTSEQVLQDA